MRNISEKFACIVAIGAGIYHFNENPVFITILIIVLSCLILFFYEEELIIYDNKFVYKSVLSLPNSRGKEYFFKDIKEVIYPVDDDVKNLQKKYLYRNNLDPQEKIHIIYKNVNEELLPIVFNNRYHGKIAVNKINEKLLYTTS